MSCWMKRFPSYGVLVLSLAVLQSCSDSGRGPTSASPAVLYSPRALSWECMHQSAGSPSGWAFGTPAVDCGPSLAPVPDAGVGLVTAAPGNLRSTITGTTVRLHWDPLAEAVTRFL